MLIVVLSGAILAIHLIGGLYPNPIAVLFTNPDGSPCQMPCLFGVRPGKMTLDEGLRILDQHPQTHRMKYKSSDAYTLTLYSQPSEISLSLDNNELIDEID